MLVKHSVLDVRTDDLKCPACSHRPLDLVVIHDVEADHCRVCGGLWFEQDELSKALARGGTTLPPSAIDVHQVSQKVGDSPRHCPECKGPLSINRCSQTVRLEVEACTQCRGFWLDKHELDHAGVLREHEQVVAQISRGLSWQEWLLGLLMAVPIEFNVKPKKQAFVTLSLVTVCILVYVSPEVIGWDRYDRLLEFGTFVPASFPTQPWFIGLFLSQFLHGSFMHLAGNMYFLYVLGDNVEDALGHWGFLALYILSDVAGNLLHFAAAPHDINGCIGASGAISGVMAAYMVYFSHARLTFPLYFVHIRLPVVFYMAVIVGFDIAGAWSKGDSVAHFAHIGGFILGYAVARLTKGYVLRRNPVLRFVKPVEGRRPLKKLLSLNFRN